MEWCYRNLQVVDFFLKDGRPFRFKICMNRIYSNIHPSVINAPTHFMQTNMTKCHSNWLSNVKVPYFGSIIVSWTSFSGLLNCNAPRAFIRINTVSYLQFDRMFSFGMIVFLVSRHWWKLCHAIIKTVIRISPGKSALENTDQLQLVEWLVVDDLCILHAHSELHIHIEHACET